MPLTLYLVCVFLFGMASGVNMSMARTIVLECAPASHRARLLSIFQLGYLGAAPIGALTMGYLTALLGPFHTALIAGSIMGFVILVVLPKAGLWRYQKESVF